MPRLAPAALVCAVAVMACEHSQPPSGVSDRWLGPWQAGVPARLAAFGVDAVGLSADGETVLFLKRNRTPMRDPDGSRSSRDTADVCLGLLPSRGGSGRFMDCDRRAGQLDSLNRVVTAALDREDRILSVVSVGPIDTFVPVQEHLELYLGTTRDKGDRRRLMTLYRDRFGQAVVPPGTLNWLSHLTWLGPDRFAALGYHARPALSLQLDYLGIVIGQIGKDSATTTVLAGRPRPFQIGAGPDGSILLVYGSGEILATTIAGEDLWSTQVPIAPGARLLAAGCRPGGCTAVTEEAAPGTLQRWLIDPSGGPARQGTTSQAGAGVDRLFVSSSDGALIYTTSAGLFRIE